MDLQGWLNLARCMTYSSHYAAPILESADPPERRLGGTQRDRVAGRSDGMLVVGSSLIVYSGFRFVEIRARRGIPIAAVRLGRSRADDLLALKMVSPVRALACFGRRE